MDEESAYPYHYHYVYLESRCMRNRDHVVCGEEEGSARDERKP